MRLFLILIPFFYFNLLNAKSIKCKFEEVYSDGSTQLGEVLFHEGLLRYQYNDQQLFTIIYNKDFFIIRNDNPDIVNKIKKNELLNELTFILSKYPNIDEKYSSNNLDIFIEPSVKIDFLKRVSINSVDVNLSIYFIDCKFKELSKQYFQPFSLTKFN